MKEYCRRSALKSFIWRIVGVIILATITYLITGDWKVMAAVTLTYIGIKHVIYVLNEFVWKEKKRKINKKDFKKS